MDSTDPAFWFDVGKEINEWGLQNYCQQHCLLVIDFCHRKKDLLDEQDFQRLTQLSDMAYMLLQFDAAVKLLEAEKEVDRVCEKPLDELSLRQAHLVSALASDHTHLIKSNDARAELERINPLLCSTVMTKALERANKGNKVLENLLANASVGLPFSITVEGAGTSGVNGIYLRSEGFDTENPSYSMSGFWKGLSAEFRILCFVNKMGDTFWTVSHFYHAKPFISEPLWCLPSNSGWHALGIIEAMPAPRLTYNFHP